MRQQILHEGARELEYEIRGIVKKGRKLEDLGKEIIWENIGDPVKKNARLPEWMKEVVISLVKEDSTYAYTDSKGVLETREFLAQVTNKKGGAQIDREDILFFNGLGDAISKLYQYLHSASRVIGPSPAYSTHSSAEAAHANHKPITYKLNPENNWYPDMDDLYNKVKYNPSIVAILIINPDNPTGMVYPRSILKRIVEIAREFNLFLISDEVYLNITYGDDKAYALAEIIEDVPGIALKGISKEIPWPGARCGWMEFYNRSEDGDFNKLCLALENAKMIEVCATILPQLAIPKILNDSRYQAYREEENKKIGIRSQIVSEILSDIPYIYFNSTAGSFFNTIVFKPEYLDYDQSLPVEDQRVDSLLQNWLKEVRAPDQRFVYYLLASKQVCVVPISSFCSELNGFRVTLLETDEAKLRETFSKIADGIHAYVQSSKAILDR